MNFFDELQQSMDNHLQMSYMEVGNYISFGGNYVEPWGDFGPAGLCIRGAVLSEADAGASLPGFFAQDRRDALVRRYLVRSMGGPSELFRLGPQVRGTGSLDRLGLAPSVRPPEVDRQ